MFRILRKGFGLDPVCFDELLRVRSEQSLLLHNYSPRPRQQVGLVEHLIRLGMSWMIRG